MPEREAGGRLNWIYDFTTNSINFTPIAIPVPGSEVRVEYTSQCI